MKGRLTSSSIINHQSRIINHQSPITTYRSSIINRQSSIINHQSSTIIIIINHQTPIINHQSPIINHQSSSTIINHQPSIINNHHQASSIIINHHQSSASASSSISISIIKHHQASSITITITIFTSIYQSITNQTKGNNSKAKQRILIQLTLFCLFLSLLRQVHLSSPTHSLCSSLSLPGSSSGSCQFLSIQRVFVENFIATLLLRQARVCSVYHTASFLNVLHLPAIFCSLSCFPWRVCLHCLHLLLLQQLQLQLHSGRLLRHRCACQSDRGCRRCHCWR